MTPETLAPPPPAQRRRSGLGEALRTTLLALVVFLLARTCVLPYEVDGASMTPNLTNHERVLVNQAVYAHLDLYSLVDWLPGVEHQDAWTVYPFHPPQRGDVVVLRPPVPNADKPYIKRIIGLPGETVEIHDGAVFIDGQLLDEPYLDGASTACDGGCQTGRVPEGMVYVLGDNRDNSSDSRVFGVVPIEDIIGKAWFSNWPLDTFGLIDGYDYPEE